MERGRGKRRGRRWVAPVAAGLLLAAFAAVILYVAWSPRSPALTFEKAPRGSPRLLVANGILGTVYRSRNPILQNRTLVSVPQTIWQTGRSCKDTPPATTALFNSWTAHNPEWDHFFLDDDDVNAFVAAHYNGSVLAAFRDLPLGVMRADAFRYMVVYHYGGVYADMDTECRQPVHAWAPRGCRFALALENEQHLCQWAFAAVAGHGALRSVIDLMLQRMLSGVARQYLEEGNEEFVHEVTGPGVFTEGVLSYLGIEAGAGEDDVDLGVLHRERGEELRATGVCLWTWEELQESLGNMYSSQKEELQTDTWSSWTEERAALLKRVNESAGSGALITPE